MTTPSSDAVPKKWDATKITSQKGKRVVITGANSGIGYVTALELARHGADVVLACRSEAKGMEAAKAIQEELKLSPQAGKVEFRKLDVSSLASVRAFSNEFKATDDRLDVLVNNAGIMAVPYAVTEDGFESQFATNHLGHFALTAQLLGLLKNSKNARIVNVSSMVHKNANVDLNELMTPEDKYNDMAVYNNTKVYNLLFTYELNRRFQANGVSNIIAVAAHPGISSTNLSIPMLANANWLKRMFLKFFFSLPITQTPEYGALPSLYAASAQSVHANDFFGPDGFGTMTGYPTKEEPTNVSKSEEHSTKLWQESERLAKLSYTF